MANLEDIWGVEEFYTQKDKNNTKGDYTPLVEEFFYSKQY